MKATENEDEYIATMEFMELIEIDYKGIKIDECSECCGIWLDAGELSVVSKLERGALDKLFSIFKSS